MNSVLRILLLMLSLTICSKAIAVGADGWEVMQLAHSSIKEVKGTAKAWDPGDSDYDFLIYRPEKIGDYISFTINIPVDGNYSPQTTSWKDGDEGIYEFEVDDNIKTGPEHDFYQSNVWGHGTYYVKAGTYTVTYRLIGKNPKSGGIGVRLGNLHWRRSN